MKPQKKIVTVTRYAHYFDGVHWRRYAFTVDGAGDASSGT